jgi:hypothetical protein
MTHNLTLILISEIKDNNDYTVLKATCPNQLLRTLLQYWKSQANYLETRTVHLQPGTFDPLRRRKEGTVVLTSVDTKRRGNTSINWLVADELDLRGKKINTNGG